MGTRKISKQKSFFFELGRGEYMKKIVLLGAIPLGAVLFLQVLKMLFYTHPIIVPLEKYIKNETKYVKDMAISHVGPSCMITVEVSKKLSFEEAQEIFNKSIVFLEEENIYKDIVVYRKNNKESIIVNMSIGFAMEDKDVYRFRAHPLTKENPDDSLKGLEWQVENWLSEEAIIESYDWKY